MIEANDKLEVAVNGVLQQLNNEEDKALFRTLIQDEKFLSLGNSFIQSVHAQFRKTGKLSHKQINAFISIARNYARRKAAMEGLPQYKRGEKIFLEGAFVESFEEVEVPCRFTRTGVTTTKKVKIKCQGFTYILKTNSKKFVPIFQNAFDEKKPLDVFAKVSNALSLSPVVFLTTVGAKIMEAI